MQKTYTYIQTPTHRYLSVSIKEVKRLNLVNKISKYSYMDSERVYLEEDSDASLFIDAKNKSNEKVDMKSSSRETNDIKQNGRYDAFTVNLLGYTFQ